MLIKFLLMNENGCQADGGQAGGLWLLASGFPHSIIKKLIMISLSIK